MPERIAELFRQVPAEKDSARRVELMRELRMLLAEDRKRMRARTVSVRANVSDPGSHQDSRPGPNLIKNAREFIRLIRRGFHKPALLP